LLTRETARVAHSKTSFASRALLEVLPGFEFSPLETVVKKSCKKYLDALGKGEITV
jgi:hypothetical protein